MYLSFPFVFKSVFLEVNPILGDSVLTILQLLFLFSLV